MGKALINKHFAGLFNGISQQAPTLRLETQAQKQINGWSSLIYGLMSRPPTKYVNKISANASANSLYYAIKRDVEEQYILGIHSNNNMLEICDLKGAKYPVVGQNEYIYTSNPKRDLAVTSIGDYTFIVNKTKKVQMLSTNDNFFVSNPAQCKVTLTSVVSGNYDVIVDGSTIASVASHKTISTGSVAKTNQEILEDLRNTINSQGLFSATYVTGNFFTFRKTNGESFTASANGSSLTLNYTAPTTTTLLFDKVAYVYVAKGVAEQSYSVLIDDVVRASYTTGTTTQGSTYRTENITNQLYTQLTNNLREFNISKVGNVIRIYRTNGADFNFATVDSWGDAALKGFKGQTQSFSDLPARCFNNAVLKIVGKKDQNEGAYWVKYVDKYLKNGEEIHTTGIWQETREPNKKHLFDKATMPVQVVRKQDISKYKTATNPYGIYFSIEPCLWANREVGDDNSAPTPSFVGQSINDIFLFNNRLGFLAGQSVCLTKVGDFFNFFPATATDSLDDDPIDLEAPTKEATNLLYSVSHREFLLLFAEQEQFILTANGDSLTSKTATIVNSINYPCDKNTSPITAGQMAYFVTPRGKFANVREYYIQAEGFISSSPNVTEHCPTFIPFLADGYSLINVPNEDMLLFGGDKNKIYVYKYNWIGDQKTQSSWSIWEFKREILSIMEFNNSVYFIYFDGTLEKMEFVKDSEILNVDGLKKVNANTTFKGATNLSVFNMQGQYLSETSLGNNSFNEDVYIGYSYKFNYEFSPLYIKTTNEPVGDVELKALYRRARVFLENKTAFKLKVNDLESANTKIEYDYITPQDKKDRYDRSFLIKGDTTKTTIEIESTSTKPVFLQSVSFEILVAQRSQKV